MALGCLVFRFCDDVGQAIEFSRIRVYRDA